MHRILVIEDDAAILRGLRDNLSFEAYDVITAVDGESGYRLLRERSPDLVVLDLMLPDIAGLDLCRRVRAEGITTPIVMLTAHGEERQRVQGFDCGADDYVSKPFSLDELLARIRSLLRHRHEWWREREEFSGDLRRAAEVQRQLLPQSRPASKALEYAGVCRPARAVGGDYYDFIPLAADRLALLVADVSGKGIAAALTMASLHALIRNEAPRFGLRCDALAAHINTALHGMTGDCRYATMFYGVFDSSNRTLTYVNAGHPAALIVPASRREDATRYLESSASPLGMFPSLASALSIAQLEPGDYLLIFSDGLTEAVTCDGEEFGRDRIAELARRCGQAGAERLQQLIIADVERHTAESRTQDDVTLIVGQVL